VKHGDYVGDARKRLEPDEAARAWAAGLDLPVDEAVAEALRRPTAPLASGSD
jgi:elongation factor P--beta-lysine ligase